MTDILIALCNVGLSLVFLPTVWHNLSRGHCGIPLYTSIPRTALISGLCVTYLYMGLVIAGAVLLIDIGCWLVLIIQRLANGKS